MNLPTPDETILGLLAQEPQHGYQILDTFNDPARLGAVWHMSTSQIYAVLKRLEQRGLIAGRQVEVLDAPTRTEYRITEAGRARLRDWLDEPCPSASIRRVRVEFLSRLYVAQLLDLPSADLITGQKAACENEKAHLLEQRHTLAAGIGGLALDLNIAQLDAVLQWMDRCEAVSETPIR